MSSPAQRDKTHGNGPSKNPRPWRGRTGRPLRGRQYPWGRRPWAAGTKSESLPTATQFLPNLNPFGFAPSTGTKGSERCSRFAGTLEFLHLAVSRRRPRNRGSHARPKMLSACLEKPLTRPSADGHPLPKGARGHFSWFLGVPQPTHSGLPQNPLLPRAGVGRKRCRPRHCSRQRKAG
jgi:hypothetical protein